MNVVPLRLRPIGAEEMLCVSDSGRFFAAPEAFVDRLVGADLAAADHAFLEQQGLTIDPENPLHFASYAHAVAQRLERAGALDYLILVPTLRCNLSCSYCQVSRADIRQAGYDWDESVTAAVLDRIDGLATHRLKVEFQGGEPTLRLDLVRAVIDRCARFEDRQFVICTNLSHISEDLLDLLEDPHVFISTSLDGGFATHQRNRTGVEAETRAFLSNLEAVISRFGPGKLAALPTIDPASPPDPGELIDSFASHGLDSIYLRPINFHGFARKRHQQSRTLSQDWRAYYELFVRELIRQNWTDRDRVLEEAYLTLCLRRIFHPGRERHVDLRNPNPVGADYVVIDHDGIVYPTDEARMLSRSGVVDLSIGDVFTGWDTETRRLLNEHSSNQFDPACQRCAYQPFCGRDVVDDLARYGRIDVPRLETDFCRRHMHLFDFIFSLIYSDDEATRYSLARWLRLPAPDTVPGPRCP
jgi:His-Xaa-Ser system radical SAM maturase HxsB